MAKASSAETDPTFHFRCPVQIISVIDAAAQRELISRSAYARRALMRSLRADGLINDVNGPSPQGARRDSAA